MEDSSTFVDDRDYQKIVQLTRQAAERHHWKAMLNLASLYVEGRDRPNGDDEAMMLVSDAMELGVPAAYDRMGTYYLNGTGVFGNVDRAFAFFQRAAAMGNPHAMSTTRGHSAMTCLVTHSTSTPTAASPTSTQGITVCRAHAWHAPQCKAAGDLSAPCHRAPCAKAGKHTEACRRPGAPSALSPDGERTIHKPPPGAPPCTHKPCPSMYSTPTHKPTPPSAHWEKRGSM
ncbi:hypothetical protein [Massilia sp. DWR3-1-1]|uniref:tetratricopeptide repeat protein n=1 Tax=Massilia sp. DWR3-1-1 TaxID=2804559 RepID=UPI003CF2CA8D